MIYMLDSAYAPTLAQAQQANANKVRMWGGYLEGGRVYHAWSRQDFDVIRQAGMRPVFIHVGTDGKEAVANAWKAGAQTGDIVALDVEAGWNDTYSQAWQATVKAAGFKTWLYGLGTETQAHGSTFDGTWQAAYTFPVEPIPSPTNSFQYWNSHQEFGVGVDRSVCADHWYTEKSMDNETARGIIYTLRAALLGEDAASPSEAQSVEASVGAVTANAEAGLSALIAQCEADPRNIHHRLAAAEKALAATPPPQAPQVPQPDLAPLLARLSALENRLIQVAKDLS